MSLLANTASPKTVACIPNNSILQQSSNKTAVGLSPINPVTEKSISIPKRGGLVYKTSRWIGGLFSDKPKPPPLVRKQPIFTLSEDFRRIPEMIAMIGNNSDKSASIGVEAWGKKVENQTFVILKLSMFGMRMDGRFECVTLRTKFTDGNDSINTYFMMIG